MAAGSPKGVRRMLGMAKTSWIALAALVLLSLASGVSDALSLGVDVSPFRSGLIRAALSTGLLVPVFVLGALIRQGIVESAATRKVRFFVGAIVLSAVGALHLTLNLLGLGDLLLIMLPWDAMDLVLRHSAEVHRLWWGTALVMVIISMTRREPWPAAVKVGFVLLLAVVWIGWELVLCVMGTF